MANNREKSIRDAVFQALNGNLSYNSDEVFVYDSKLEGEDDLYVLITDQTAQYSGNFAEHAWDCSIILQIVSRTADTISRDIIDEVSKQIEDIIIESLPTLNGLVTQLGWQIINNSLGNVTYTNFTMTDTQSAITKLLTFNQKVVKL